MRKLIQALGVTLGGMLICLPAGAITRSVNGAAGHTDTGAPMPSWASFFDGSLKLANTSNTGFLNWYTEMPIDSLGWYNVTLNGFRTGGAFLGVKLVAYNPAGQVIGSTPLASCIGSGQCTAMSDFVGVTAVGGSLQVRSSISIPAGTTASIISYNLTQE